jgi:CHAT domain-containing protein
VFSLKGLRTVIRTSKASKPFIGIGNPLLDGSAGNSFEAAWAAEARAKQTCSGLPASSRAVALRARRSPSVTQRAGFADLEQLRSAAPLPDTADELCAAGTAMNATANDLYLGARATETILKSLSESGALADYRVIHFATHGALAGDVLGANEPGLILTPPTQQTPLDDGYLTASEIAHLWVDADWVVLSACNTAGGEAGTTEAMSGVASAFLYAGARALLVSHWPVDSEAAVKLVTNTLTTLKANVKIGRAQALHQSMSAMIQRGSLREAHPAVWAPFVIVGEGSRVE